jgi:hypothetical protein|tara:strand:- start:895 stop:1164 length:270 start_codon:yes stop_codon:yes gene_type:complete
MIIGDSKQVAITFENGNKIVSLSLDNSLGRMETMRRGMILLIVESDDVTSEVFEEAADGHAVHASLDNFEKAMIWLRRVEWGMEVNNDM